MDGLNLDLGLRQAYTKQTQQRLLIEANNARMLKSVKNQIPGPRKLKQATFGGKIRVIGKIIRESGYNLISVIKASSRTANA